MEIAGMLAAERLLSGALGQLGKRRQSQQAAPSPSPGTPTAPVAAMAESSTFREIVARYDVTDISPEEFSQMIQKLYDAGLLTDQQFQELSLIRLDLDLQRVEPDQTVDLVDFYRDRLRQLHLCPEETTGLDSAGGQPQLAAIGRRLEWVGKLASMQAAVEGAGLDALA